MRKKATRVCECGGMSFTIKQRDGTLYSCCNNIRCNKITELDVNDGMWRNTK